MRIKPVTPYVYLESAQDEVLCGFNIPAGTMIATLMVTEGFSEDIFENAHEYHPRRWLEMSDEHQKLHAKTLLPFGYGPRMCPGRQLSLAEMKVALIELLYRFKFKRGDDYGKAKECLKFTVKPCELIVDVEPR